MYIALKSPKTPEDRAEIGRKLAITLGLPVSEIGEFIVRKAAIEKPVKAHDEDRAEIGRKLAIAAGLLPMDGSYSRSEIIRVAKAKPHDVTLGSNDNNSEEKAEIGRKLAIAAGLL